MNLAEFPLGVLHGKEEPDRHTVSFEDKVTDSRFRDPVNRRVTVTSSPAFGGLPTTFDQDILLGLVTLTKANNDFSSRKVYFTRHQLIELLGLPDSGQTYKRITRSLHKWQAITVHYEFGWWKRSEEKWADEAFAFIDNVRIHKMESLRRARQMRREGKFEFPLSYFAWNDVVFQSFRDDYIRTLDLEFYTSLRLPSSKRIYRFLAKRFYLSRELRFDLACFAFEKVGLSRVHEGRLSRAKSKLLPAIRELENRGFLKPMPEDQRFLKLGRGEWEIRFSAASRRTDRESGTQVSCDDVVQGLLVKRGVHGQRAEELVARFGEERVRTKVAHWDYLHASGKKPRTPLGYLVASIVDDYAAPDGFEKVSPTRSSRGISNSVEREAEQSSRMHQAELDSAWNWFRSLCGGDQASVRLRILERSSAYEVRHMPRNDSMLFRCKLVDAWKRRARVQVRM